MTLAAVRAELVSKLDAVSGVDRVFGFAPDDINPPAAFVGTMRFDPRAAMTGVDNMSTEVWYVVSRGADQIRGAAAIDTQVEAIIAGLEGSPTSWDSLAVTEVEFPVSVTFGAATYMAARFDCDIYL